MPTTFKEMSDPSVEPPQRSRLFDGRLSESEEVLAEDWAFSFRDLERFQEDDAQAARAICSIMSTLFTISVALALTVVTWTFTRGLCSGPSPASR